MNRALLLVALIALGACGPSVSGRVEGEPVGGARDAIFDELTVQIPILGEFKLIAVIVSDVPDACETFDAFFDNVELDCQEQCEDWGRIADEQLGRDEYWNLSMSMWADPARVEGDYALAEAAGENEFSAQFSRLDVSALYDETTCMETCQSDDLLIVDDNDNPSSGTLTLTSYTAQESVKGEFDLNFGADTLSGGFTAERCEAISTWFNLGE